MSRRQGPALWPPGDAQSIKTERTDQPTAPDLFGRELAASDQAANPPRLQIKDNGGAFDRRPRNQNHCEIMPLTAYLCNNRDDREIAPYAVYLRKTESSAVPL